MDPSYLGQPLPVPTTKKPTGIMTKRTLFIVVGLVGVILMGVLLLTLSADRSGPLMQRMSLRQKVTLQLLQDGRKNIRNDDLQKINSELILLLTGHTTRLEAAFKKNNMPKIDLKKMQNPETSKPLLEKLNTAKLNARYDETYRSTLILQLQSLNQLSQELYKKTKSTSLKTVLSAQYKDIARYLKQLDALPPA